MSINRVIISGNLTRDPELRSTAGGMPVLGFGVAVNDRRKNQQTGEWEDYPNFIDCTMFGARAEALSRYLNKGTKVSIEGKLRWSQWEREGQKRSKIEVIVDEIEFMEAQQGYRQAQPAHQPQQGCRQPAPRQGYQPQPARVPRQPVQPPLPQQPPAVDAYGGAVPSELSDPMAYAYDEDIPF